MTFNSYGFNTTPLNTPTPERLRKLYKIRAGDTPEGRERLRAYYEALGRFIAMFAEVETAVTQTLWLYAGTRPTIAKVVFAGAKIDISLTYIKQLAEAVDAPQEARADLEYILQQLGIINGVRNAVLHYGATSIAEGNAVVSNALRAKSEPTVFPISPTALDEMTFDLRKIIYHLHYRHMGRQGPRGDYGKAVLDGALSAAWRYKHPTPPKTHPKGAQQKQPRKRDLKRPGQPRPFQE
jgi:hypothetical protein